MFWKAFHFHCQNLKGWNLYIIIELIFWEVLNLKNFLCSVKMIKTILMLSTKTQDLISLPSSHVSLASFTHTHIHTEIIKISEWIQIRNYGDPLIPMNHKPSPVQLIHQSITTHPCYSLINNIFLRKLSSRLLSLQICNRNVTIHLYNQTWVSISGKRVSLAN